MSEADVRIAPRANPTTPWAVGAHGDTTMRARTLLLALLAGRGGSCWRSVPPLLGKPW